MTLTKNISNNDNKILFNKQSRYVHINETCIVDKKIYQSSYMNLYSLDFS